MYKAADKWLVPYVRSARNRPPVPESTKHVVFCMADHFEPFSGGVGRDHALRRVHRWAKALPDIAGAFTDADGIGPRQTFFLPHDEYDEACVAGVAQMCRSGVGEIELQLHHRNDTAESLAEKLEMAKTCLHENHQSLGKDSLGRIRYGFVHGNWSLCNSRPDGDWCGVDEELRVLSSTGCYADFTFPSAPSPTQPRIVNSIYRSVDSPGRARGHDKGEPAFAGDAGCKRRDARSLLLVQGPLALNWQRRKWGILPRLENGVISADNPPSEERADLWVKQHVHVLGRPEWVFVKVTTHGAVESNADVLLGEPMRKLQNHLQARYNDGREWLLHYVTAREMYNIVRAAEDGVDGDPGAYRGYEVNLVK